MAKDLTDIVMSKRNDRVTVSMQIEMRYALTTYARLHGMTLTGVLYHIILQYITKHAAEFGFKDITVKEIDNLEFGRNHTSKTKKAENH